MPNYNPNTSGMIPFDKLSSTERTEIAVKGGVASGEARRRKKTLRQELETMLEVLVKDKAGNDISVQHAITGALLQKANKGDVRAFEVIRDTIGEKPVEKQELSTGDGAFVVQFKPSLDKPIEADEWETILAEREKKQCQQ